MNATHHIYSLILIAVSLELLSPTPARATVLLDMSLADLVAQSDVIVIGVVKDQWSEWSEDTHQIHTYTEVAVSEYIEGAGRSRILIRQRGGKVGDVTMRVAGNATLEKGEEVLLFLERREVHFVVGMELGKYAVRTMDDGAQRVYRNATVTVVSRDGVDKGSSNYDYSGWLLHVFVDEIGDIVGRRKGR